MIKYIVGDGNLHLNIQLNNHDQDEVDRIENFLFQKVVKMKGSMSAEHGLGFIKSKYLTLSKPENVVQLMKDLKRTFDPNNIMNPYKIFS